MIHRGFFGFKQAVLWVMVLISEFLSVCAIIIGLTSIWMGIRRFPQAGFWMPILTGAILVAAVLWMLVGLTRFVFHKLKDRAVVRVK